MYNESRNKCLVRKEESYILTAMYLKYILIWMLTYKDQKKEKKKERVDA